MPRPIIIIHFQPLELYPPIINLLNYIYTYHKDQQVLIFSTVSANGNVGQFSIKDRHIRIIRLGKSGYISHLILRVLNYIYFYFASFFLMIINRPRAIIYFETLSSFPAYLYKKHISNKVPLFIHYHEYTSLKEYDTGMKIVAFFHKKEKKMYRNAAWISHTNEERMSRFLIDEELSCLNNTFIMPNFPPKSWDTKLNAVKSNPIKIVYAGALSLDTMYTENFANWIQIFNGKLTWDIYSRNITDDARLFLQKLNCPYINLYDGVDYWQLPSILPKYHVGVILYKGHIANYIYNAPNKLFEYIACNLDVWFPDVMLGCFPYITSNSYPKVTDLNFNELNKIDLKKVLNKSELAYKKSPYFNEDTYSHFMNYVITYS